MTDQKHIVLDPDCHLVVGGGIGGLATALALSNSGQRVRLIERAPAYAEVGAGLQIGPNGSRALDRLGVLPALSAKAIFPERISINDIRTGKQLTHLDLGADFVERYGYRYMVMHRSDLLEALLEAARLSKLVTLENNRHVTGVETEGNISKVTCADGTVFETHSLIGADGNMSVVRRALFGPMSPQGEGYVVYRGTVPFKEMNADAEGDAIVLYVGDGVHLIQYPIRGGELYNQAATFLSSRYSADHDDWGTEAELEEAFSNVAPIVRRSLACVDRSMRWPARHLAPFRPWRRGSAVLIGDAAHAMYQYVAQGACQALEDAATLGRCVAQHETPNAAFAAFEECRLLRTTRVQLTARNFGEVIHYGGLDAEVRDAILLARDPKDYSHVDWLYADHGHF